jgi:hypothetical protein
MFRTSIALVAAIAIAAGFAPIAPAAPAIAAQNSAVDLCRTVLLPGRPASNLGECSSYINVAQNGSDGEVSHFCDFLQENDPDIFELMFVSKSECIHVYGQRGPNK